MDDPLGLYEKKDDPLGLYGPSVGQGAVEPRGDMKVDKDLSLGIRQSASSFNKLLANATGVLDWGAKKIEELTGLKREGGFQVAQYYLNQMAENIKPTKEEWQERSSLPSKIWQAIAMTPGTIAEYGVGTALAGGNPVAGMAMIDMLREADKGEREVIMAGLKGATMGGILKAVAPLQRVTRAATMAGVGAGETVIQGGDASDVIVGALTMGGLGLMGGKGIPLKQAMSDQRIIPMEYVAGQAPKVRYKDFNEYLQGQLDEGKIKLTTPQFKSLVENASAFPYGKEIVTPLGEKVVLKAPEGHDPWMYINHFLTKRSEGRNEPFFSQTHLNLVGKITETIETYDQRILAEKDGQDRIYYVKEYPGKGNKPNHIAVASVGTDGTLLGWTHFKATKSYKEGMLADERSFVDKRGLRDAEGNTVDISYDEYLNRRSPLYLGGDAEQGLRRSQESPPNPVPSIAAKNFSVNPPFQSALIPGLAEFVRDDLSPATRTILSGTKDTIRSIVRWIAPRVGVKTETLDMIMKMKGERDYNEFVLERTTRDMEKTFDGMARAEQIAFIDKVKRGELQGTPELQQLSDFIRSMDDALYAELIKVKPSVPFLENHFRVLWKVIPGTLQEKLIGAFRRPLEGGKGYMKQHTLNDMSEGLAMGGEPYSYNPITMFKAHYADVMKYITAQKMWQGLKDVGDRVFVRFGEKAPEGFTKIDDKISQVYFPVDEGMVKAGEWYVEENAARLLNRHLGRDMIREAALGRGLLWLKNSTTAMELSLSAFHFVFETIETTASNLGLGMTKIWNQGIREGNMKAILEGAKDIALSPVTPFLTARYGGSAIKYVTDPNGFLATTRGQDFIAKFPEAANLISDLFTGGGKLAMHQDYKINSIKAFQESLSANNYIGAAIRSIPAFNEMLMKPMFETYIPRLKIGMFLKEYSNALVERAGEVQRGETTKPEIARRTWDFVEDRLGEMNFDNLFWDRTFKSGLQILIRSVTWKLGNIRGFGKAFEKQARELWDATLERRIPKLEPEMAWAWGVVATHVAIATTINYLSTGESPKDYKDMVYPRVNNEGDRVSVPTYLRDAFHLMHKPAGWATSSLSGWIGRFNEVIRNKDFYGSQVRNPDEDWASQTWDSLVHMAPLPFSVTSMKAMQEKGETIDRQAIGFLGFTKAPYYIEQTEAHQMANEIIADMMPQGAQSKEDVARRKIVKQYVETYRKALRSDNKERQVEVMKGLSDDVFAGKIHMNDVDNFTRRLQVEPFEGAVKRLSARDALKIWKVATDDEKFTMLPLMMDKFDNLMERRPEEYQAQIERIQNWWKEAQALYQKRKAQ